MEVTGRVLVIAILVIYVNNFAYDSDPLTYAAGVLLC